MPDPSAVNIAIEPFSLSLFDELLPLARKCWGENTAAKTKTCAFDGERDFDIEPDVEQYERLANAGALLLVTLRDEGKLQGYIVGILYRAMHHRHFKAAGGDSIYIEPPYRSHARAMIGRFESAMKEQGATIIGWPTHPEGAVYELLKVLGYVGDDIVMEKRLCA